MNTRYNLDVHKIFIWNIKGYGTSTDKFDNHVFKCINKNDHVAKEPYFTVYAFMTSLFT